MKRTFVFLIVSAIMFTFVLPVKKVILKKDSDYLERLLNNNIYFKKIRDIDNDLNHIYFLDGERSQVFQVDFASAKLVNTFFRRGQGPSELMTPYSLKVKNQKIFVLDSGFNGIKIMDMDGKLVNEFRVKGMMGERKFDVNDKNEIFIPEYNSVLSTYISVYDLNGRLLRSIGKLDKKKRRLPLNRIHYILRLDGNGNIILLFTVTRELFKLNPKGVVIWYAKVSNEILDKYSENNVKLGENDTIHTSYAIFDLNIVKSNQIFIGHASGGCIYNDRGELTDLIYSEKPRNIGEFALIGGKLVNVLVWGRIIITYDFKEKQL